MRIPFEWHTDHRNLTYFMEKQDLTSRQHRWSQVISQYNYTTHHKDGKKMYLTDPMSVSDRLLRMEEVLESSTKREEREKREVEWRVWWVRLD